MKTESAIDFEKPLEWALHFESAIKAESARASAILSAVYLNDLLEKYLKMMLFPSSSKNDRLFDGPQSPLSSFSSKVEMALRMGVISSEEAESLHLVRRIRNRFAHDLGGCTFEESVIKQWISRLDQLNDVAEEETRAKFADGFRGDFEKSVSWLIFNINTKIQAVPAGCPRCDVPMSHRDEIRLASPE